MNVLRRDFLKCCVGSVAALGLDFFVLGTVEKVLAAGGSIRVPSYPIATRVYTTLDRTIAIVNPPAPYPKKILLPGQVSKYAANQYGEWIRDEKGFPDGAGLPYLRPEMRLNGDVEPSVPDPKATPLLSFFTISDIHIADKESPAQCNYLGYIYPELKTPQTGSPPNYPVGNSSAYSAVILYTVHVLDAAVQTINALHKKAPFDFGISLGDAANNTQYNELRWYIDVLDGKMITPSSGSHRGAGVIDYQKPFKAAGLDRSIPWYQAIGNHDQFWMGSTHVTAHLRKAYVGSGVLNIGRITTVPPNFPLVLSKRGFYMGVVDGTTKYGSIIHAGPSSKFKTPPKIAADPNRRSLSVGEWMNEFLNTTSSPAGHGFTREMIENEFACYSFHPRAGIPIKVIVLDDTDKFGGGAAASLDPKRFNWLKRELDEGEAAGELMIICAHIPLRPYAQNPSSPGSSSYPLWSLWDKQSSTKTEDDVLKLLHSYKNLILWCSGHVHRNAITPKPSPDKVPEHAFWEVETSSLRDFPQQLRRFDILLNTDNTISIFALDIDVAANPAPLADGSASPAFTSRSYAIATQEIFQNRIPQGPNIDPQTGVYNAELIMPLSSRMQKKLANLRPVVALFKINGGASSTTSRTVTLNNNVLASKPAKYKASEFPDFRGAAWLPYSKAPSFKLGKTTGSGSKTVYFKVKDAEGKESEVVSDSIHG